MSKRKDRYLAYLASDTWTKIRCDMFMLRDGKCELCGKAGTQVHHLTYENLGHEEPTDLILLCGKCHQKEHGLIKPKPKRKKKGKPKKTRGCKRICPKCMETLSYSHSTWTCACGYAKANL